MGKILIHYYTRTIKFNNKSGNFKNVAKNEQKNRHSKEDTRLKIKIPTTLIFRKNLTYYIILAIALYVKSIKPNGICEYM